MNMGAHQLKTLAEQYPEFAKNPHSWAAMVELYRDDVENWGGSPQMLRLVERLADQMYADAFSPGTSHMRLVIGTEAYPREPVDSLVVSWDDWRRVYQLDYYEAGRSKLEKRTCGWPQVFDFIELKLLRMMLFRFGGAPKSSFGLRSNITTRSWRG
jgi:hypothetical protein